MTSHIATTLALVLPSLLGACSLAPVEPQPATPTRPVAAPTLPLAQLGHGPEAGFARCATPDCGRPTPKTLARFTAPPRDASPLVGQDTPPASPAAAPPPWTAAAPTPSAAPPSPQRRPPPASTVAPAAPTVMLYFAHGDATLAPSDRLRLDEALRQHATTATLIRISAGTGGQADRPVNRALARARAEAVRAHVANRLPRLATRLQIEADSRSAAIPPHQAPASDLDEALRRRVVVVFEPDVRPD